MNEKRVLKLSIFNRDYVISTDESEKHIYNAANIVNNLVREITKKVDQGNENKVAVLAALQLAVDLTKRNEQDKDRELKLNDLLTLLKNYSSSVD